MDFIMKQALGGATKDLNKMMDKGSEEADPKALEEEKERLEAMAEQEEERKAKHLKVEAEREKQRQQIRDKYGLKRKDEIEAEKEAVREQETQGRLTRNKNPSMEEAEENDEGLMTQVEKTFSEVQQKVSTAADNCVIC